MWPCSVYCVLLSYCTVIKMTNSIASRSLRNFTFNLEDKEHHWPRLRRHDNGGIPSCEFKCGQMHNSECSCHKTCSFYDTCCPDYHAKCSAKFRKSGVQQQEYVYPQYWCTHDNGVIISNCENNTQTSHARGVRLLRTPENDYRFNESEETNYFPVTDLATGNMYIDWGVFKCFAQLNSKPLIWKVYVGVLQIYKVNSSIFISVDRKNVCFHQPQAENVTEAKCKHHFFNKFRNRSEKDEIFEKEDAFANCANCYAFLPTWQSKMNYRITMVPDKTHLIFRSSDPLNTWSSLECVPQREEIYENKLFRHLICKMTNYVSSFETQPSYTSERLYILKLAIHTKKMYYYNTQEISTVFLCILRQYRDINVIKIWRPTLMAYSLVIDSFFLVIKLLMNDNTRFPAGDTKLNQNILNLSRHFLNFSPKNDDTFYLHKNKGENSERQNITDYVEYLPEFESLMFFQSFNNKKVSGDFACSCSISLAEISAAKYLDTWVCPVRCDWYVLNQGNDSSDFFSKKKLCININESSKTNSKKAFKKYIFMVVLVILIT